VQIPLEDWRYTEVAKYEKDLTDGYTCRLDSAGTGYGLVVGCCKHGDDASVPITQPEFLKQLSDS
jgi:flagellar basal body P-ring protein FlgI